ncbi:hypothetical protein WDU94_015103 [Cyamophila willieti]
MAQNQPSSLNLLLEYSSSSDSENDCDKPQEPTIAKVQKPKLPLPNELLDQFQSPNQVIDNPELHRGRIRSFPHERNSWATLVYIPLKRNLTDLMTLVQKELNSLCIDVEVIAEPHLSLSKTLVIPHHWIQPLVETFGQKLQHLSRFTVKFTSVEIFCNEERTRTFIALGANSSKGSLEKVVQAVDNAAEEFKLAKYYEEPNFHASIAWCVEDKTKQLNPLRKNLSEIFNQFKVMSDDNFHVEVSNIHVKSGNKFYSFPLRS